MRIAKTEVTGLCHRVSVKELPLLTPAAVINAPESDVKDTKPAMSKSELLVSDPEVRTQVLQTKIVQEETFLERLLVSSRNGTQC